MSNAPRKAFDAYSLNSCDPRTPFNYPPVWLLLGRLGIDGSDSVWLSVAMIVVALAVMVAIFKGRSIGDGAIFAAAILSPSVLMGVERANVDFSILALVGGAALVFTEQKTSRALLAVLLIGAAIVLKLYPLFCIALAARFSRRTFLFAAAVVVISAIYFVIISDYIPLIRQNTPTSFMLSYGYKVLFLGIDHLRSEAGLTAIGLADTWIPMGLVLTTVILAVATALCHSRPESSFCQVTDGVAGTAFLFGAGIYCGSFLLGTNFVYRLMFLLLCLPQLRQWAEGTLADDRRTVTSARVLVGTILFALWMNGSPNGHTTFMLVPQLTNWLNFFGLATILVLNFVASVRAYRGGTKQLITRS